MQIYMYLSVKRFALGIALLLVAPTALAQPVAPEAGPAPASQSELMAQGLMEGRHLASQQPMGGRFMGGFLGGFGLGLIGTGIVYAVAASADTAVPPDSRVLIADRPPTYQQGYEQGYAQELRRRRTGQALTGGLVGTAVGVGLILAITSGGS